jgi:pyruvate,water dikinase
LSEALPEPQFGGKAMNLSLAIDAGLDVPGGYAMDAGFVEALAKHDSQAIEQLKSVYDKMRPPIAVRSSGVGEDSEGASFAGQHASVLNVVDEQQLGAAVAEVIASAFTDSARDYREKMGMPGNPRMGIVLQELISCEAAGVMFTRNPLSGLEERVIEAAWGLGEVVVAGLVIPDYYRLSANGEILEVKIGDKDIELRPLPGGGTEEIEIPAERAEARILSESDLQALHDLASRCEATYGFNLDIEWGRSNGRFWLLQCRAITTTSAQ